MRQNPNNNPANAELDAEDIAAFSPLVDSVCRRYLRRRHDVEDAMQDTFVKMLSHGMTPACPRLRGWLSATASSTCMDKIRKSQSETRRLVGWSQVFSNRDEEDTSGDDARRRVEAALLRLDEASRQLLVERYYRQTPLHVIAARTGVSVSTVSRWGTAALRALAGILGDANLSGENILGAG